MKPKIFIGSSVEGLSIAYAIQQNLSHDAESTVWDQGVFKISKTTIESLSDVLDTIDFAIFVFHPDDITTIRGEDSLSIRDNVLFEFGLSIGRLGRERVFFITPDGIDFHIPTDLLGVTPAKYDSNREDESFQAATGPACNQVRIEIKNLGLLNSSFMDAATVKSSDEEKLADSDWLSDLMDNNYILAKNKLESMLSSKEENKNFKYNVWLAYANLKINDSNGTKELYELSEKHNDNIETQKLIVKILLWEDYNEDAENIINTALERFQGDCQLITMHADCHKQNDNEDKAIEILTAAKPNENPEVAIELSNIYENNEDIDKAIEIIHAAFLNYPNNEKLMYRYSRLLKADDMLKGELYLLNKLNLNYPKNTDYLGYLSNCCLKLDLYNEAMVACKKAVDLSENKEAWVIENIGNMLNNKGFYTDAIAYLKKGIEIDSLSQYGHDRLATAIKNKEEERKKYNKLCKEGRRLISDHISLKSDLN